MSGKYHVKLEAIYHYFSDEKHIDSNKETIFDSLKETIAQTPHFRISLWQNKKSAHESFFFYLIRQQRSKKLLTPIC